MDSNICVRLNFTIAFKSAKCAKIILQKNSYHALESSSAILLLWLQFSRLINYVITKCDFCDVIYNKANQLHGYQKH